MLSTLQLGDAADAWLDALPVFVQSDCLLPTWQCLPSCCHVEVQGINQSDHEDQDLQALQLIKKSRDLRLTLHLYTLPAMLHNCSSMMISWYP